VPLIVAVESLFGVNEVIARTGGVVSTSVVKIDICVSPDCRERAKTPLGGPSFTRSLRRPNFPAAKKIQGRGRDTS
jgi:hypothetical protein